MAEEATKSESTHHKTHQNKTKLPIQQITQCLPTAASQQTFNKQSTTIKILNPIKKSIFEFDSTIFF